MVRVSRTVTKIIYMYRTIVHSPVPLEKITLSVEFNLEIKNTEVWLLTG